MPWVALPPDAHRLPARLTPGGFFFFCGAWTFGLAGPSAASQHGRLLSQDGHHAHAIAFAP